jgi:hypothetical protein
MAAIFFWYAFALVTLLAGWRKVSLVTALFGLLFTISMFWHHVTDILQINW